MQGYTFQCTHEDCDDPKNHTGITIEIVLDIGTPLCWTCDRPMDLKGEDEHGIHT